MDYFSALQSFHHIAEEGSFSAAAKKIGVSVSGVTRQIDLLEAKLGVALFARSTRRISLTRAGEDYLLRTAHILADLALANQAVKDGYLAPQGKLRLTMPPAFGQHRIAALLREFTACYPLIELEIITTDDFVDLSGSKMDLAVRLGRVGDDRLVAKFVAPQARWLAAAPTYLAGKGIPQTPEDLKKHNCLPFLYENRLPKWYFRRRPDEKYHSLTVKGNLICNNADMILQAALHGQGICHLPDWLVQPYIEQGKLVQLLAGWQISPNGSQENDGIYLVYPPNSRNSVKIELLIRFLSEKLKI